MIQTTNRFAILYVIGFELNDASVFCPSLCEGMLPVIEVHASGRSNRKLAACQAAHYARANRGGVQEMGRKGKTFDRLEPLVGLLNFGPVTRGP